MLFLFQVAIQDYELMKTQVEKVATIAFNKTYPGKIKTSMQSP